MLPELTQEHVYYPSHERFELAAVCLPLFLQAFTVSALGLLSTKLQVEEMIDVRKFFGWNEVMQRVPTLSVVWIDMFDGNRLRRFSLNFLVFVFPR